MPTRKHQGGTKPLRELTSIIIISLLPRRESPKAPDPSLTLTSSSPAPTTRPHTVYREPIGPSHIGSPLTQTQHWLHSPTRTERSAPLFFLAHKDCALSSVVVLQAHERDVTQNSRGGTDALSRRLLKGRQCRHLCLDSYRLFGFL